MKHTSPLQILKSNTRWKIEGGRVDTGRRVASPQPVAVSVWHSYYYSPAVITVPLLLLSFPCSAVPLLLNRFWNWPKNSQTCITVSLLKYIYLPDSLKKSHLQTFSMPQRKRAALRMPGADMLRCKWQTGSWGHARPNVWEQLPIISYCWECGRRRQRPSDGPGHANVRCGGLQTS